MLSIYDDNAEIGNGAEIAGYTRIGNYAEIGDFAKIGDCAEIGDFAKIGNHAEICNFAEIGNYAKIGNSVIIGDGAQFGDCVTVGDKFHCEGLKVIDFFTMSNVDGTGRKIHVYVHTEGITVRAGCFKGTLEEFCQKAEHEGKHLYAVTVRAAAEAFAAEIHRQGKTGGWDK